MPSFEILYHPEVTHDLAKLPHNIKQRIQRAIEERLIPDPIKYGKPLQYSFKGHRRIRVGDFRIIYRIHLPDKVYILLICHRKYVYEKIR